MHAMFKPVSGGVKELIELVLFRIIKVETSAKIAWHKDKKKKKDAEKQSAKN